MRAMQSVARRIKSLLAKNAFNVELSEELQFHLQREIEQNIADGMLPDEARTAARASFGLVSVITEDCYRARGTTWIEDLHQDIRYGLRTMIKHRAFSVLTVLTLALGIGACTAVFSLMDAVLLRSLPYGDVEQLVYLYTPSVQLLRMKVPAEVFNPSFADFEDLKKQSTSFSSMTVFRMSSFNFSGGDQLEKLGVARVDAAFFTTLQTQPELGRIFDAKDEKPGNAHVVLISHALWKSVYESKSSVLGQMVRLDGAEYKVVGVMPAGFEYPLSSDLPNVFGSVDRTQLWVPAALTSQQMTCRERCGAFAIGRLKPGTTLIQAQTELSTIMTRLDLLHSPSLNDFTAIVRPLREVALGEVKPLMFLLLGAVGLVLLIACGNAANLLLARAANRTQELGVRAALGARRGRLIRQMLTESVLLVVAAGFVGVALAWLLLRLLLQLNPGDIPRLENAGLDCRVLGFLIGVTALTSLLFGVLPSMITTDINFAEFLKRPGTRAVPGDRRAVSKALAITQIALVVTLLIGSGLFLRSYVKVLAVPTGFARSTVTVSIELIPRFSAVSANPRYDSPQKRRLFFLELLQRLESSPGVGAAGLVDLLPLSHAESMGSFEAQGYANGANQMVEMRRITPDYFSAMDIPRIRGREFAEGDGPGRPLVVIVNNALAKKYFPNSDAVGQHVRMSPDGPWAAIVGVVGDVRNAGPETGLFPELYTPLLQTDTDGAPVNEAYLAVRSVLPENVVVMGIRSVMKSLDTNLAIADIHTMKELATRATARRQFQTTLLSVFSAVSMLIVLVGIYGLLAFSVQQRSGEIGIRMALGSTRMGVAMLVLGEALILLAAGLGLGLATAVGFTRLLSRFLFEIQPIDSTTYLTVPFFLLLGTVAASLIPSLRAAHIEPMNALRNE